MLADDDTDDIELFCHALQLVDKSIFCRTSHSGNQALKALSDTTLPRPDVIFLDINMPEMNGWTCLQEIKQDKGIKDIPVIMYSTTSELEDIRRARQLGALCFYTKPNSFDQLKKMLAIVKEHVEARELKTLCEAIHSRVN